METPKPHPPKKTEETPVESKKDEKKPFVRKPHLTHRPFADNPALKRLGTRKIDPKSKRQR